MTSSNLMSTVVSRYTFVAPRAGTSRRVTASCTVSSSTCGGPAFTSNTPREAESVHRSRERFSSPLWLMM